MLNKQVNDDVQELKVHKDAVPNLACQDSAGAGISVFSRRNLEKDVLT